MERADEQWQLEAYYRLRHAVFVEEQALFEWTDIDEHDPRATSLVAVSEIAGMPDAVVGSVRIYPAEDGTFFGGRLAVARGHRRSGAVGTALIAAAVATAREHGCRRFLATVQLVSARYFERHHFHPVAPIEVRGRAHLLMEADLARFPVGGQDQAPVRAA